MLDIRLKKLIRKWYYKAAAFLLIIVMASAFLISAFKIIVNLESNDRDFSVLGSESYGESELYSREITRIADNVMTLGYAYKSIENIQSGNTVSQNEKSRIYQNLYRMWQDGELNNLRSSAVTEAQEFDNTEIYITEDIDILNSNNEFLSDPDFMQFIKDNPILLQKMKEKIIKDDLSRYSKILNFLDSESGFDYYAEIDGNVYTNLKTPKIEYSQANLEKLPYYLKMNPKQKNFQFFGKSNRPYSTDERSYRSSYSDKISDNDYFVVAVRNDYLTQQEKNWAESRNIVNYNMMVIIVTMLVSIALFIYLCLVTGRRPEDEDVHICLVDRMCTEFHLIIAITILAFVISFFENVSSFVSINQIWTVFPLILVCLCLSLAVGMAIVLSIVRSIKAKRFLHSFFTFRVIKKIWDFFKRVFKSLLDMLSGGNLMQKAVIFSILVPLLSAIWIATPFIIALLLYLSYKIVTRYNTVADGVKRVKDGDVNYKIQIDGKGELADLAEDINSLSTGLGGAISAEIRSERLKAELISNVSHDIKTPLTSVITYIDLLKNEKIENEKAREYIDIIERKAHRLKVLTSDLFEAAKASSGSMSVTLEKVDVCALVRQGLGEMSDKISDANLDFRVSMADAPLYILADGRLMWRVLENLIANAVKYALPGSRVYIDVKMVGDYILLTMKNMSAYELNIPAEELLERFKRGDESRNSDGSGLGLSIANSLTTLQKGIFKIEVDGDLFKATVAMPKYH